MQIKTEITDRATHLMTFPIDNEIILISVTNIQTDPQHCHISLYFPRYYGYQNNSCLWMGETIVSLHQTS